MYFPKILWTLFSRDMPLHFLIIQLMQKNFPSLIPPAIRLRLKFDNFFLLQRKQTDMLD